MTEVTPVTALRRQVLRPRTLIPVAVALAGLGFGLRSLLNVSLAQIGSELAHANAALLLLAVGVFYLTFPLRSIRWRVLLENVRTGVVLPPLGRLTRMLVLASFANSVSVAQLGDVWRGYLLQQEAGVALPTTLGTIVAERLVDLVTLVALLALGALSVYRGTLPEPATSALVVGLAGALGGLLGLLALPRLQPLVQRLLPVRWHATYARFEQGVVRSLRRLPLVIGTSALAWLIEGATLLLLGAAIGTPISTGGALVAGLVASLLSVEPVTPGGLGVTEPGIVLILTSQGLDPAAASTVALLNRLVNYASLALASALVARWPSFGRPARQALLPVR